MKSISRAVIRALVQFRKGKAKGARRSIQPSSAKKILVVSSTAIGDSLFAVPGIRALRTLVPGASLDFLLRDKVAPLFQGYPYVDDILQYKGRYRNGLSLLRKFHQKRYDMCIVFHDSDPCPVEVAYAAGIPLIFRIGQKDEKVAHLLSKRVPYDNSKHAIDQRLELLRQVFGVRLDSKDDLRMELPVEKDKVSQFRRKLEKETSISSNVRPLFVAFQFSASGGYKEWPMSNFVQLGVELLKLRCGLTPILIGGPGDMHRAKELKRAIESGAEEGKVIDLTGKIPIQDLPPAIKAMDLLVTNDTGPLHVAIAVGTRTVSLFVPTNVEGTGPAQDLHLHKVIVKPKPCKPCVEKYCKRPNCMSLISTKEVLEAVAGSLDVKDHGGISK